MDIFLWLDLGLFILLFVLFIYVFATVTVTKLHKVYFMFHFFMMLWPLSQFAVDISKDPHYQLIYVSLSFISLLMIGSGWLLLTIFLTGNSGKFGRKDLFLLFVPAIFGSIGLIINPSHIFVYPQHSGYIQRIYGPWFWLIIFILLSYFSVSLYFIFKALYSSKIAPMIKKQVKVTLSGIVVLAFFALSDLLLNVVLKRWLPIIPGLTSSGIFLSDLFFVFAIIRFRVFDIISIAHKDIINTIPYGILVLDENETIIEVNPALRSYAQVRVDDQFDMGKFLETVRIIDGNKAIFLEKYMNKEHAQIEIVIGQGIQSHIILQCLPIVIQRHSRIGSTITFQDISQLRYLVNEMNKKNNLLEEQNFSLISIRDELFQANKKLEEIAYIDGLTQCFNRRYLTEHLTHVVVTNIRNEIPFSLILFDIDHFKWINDSYGHITGDEVLFRTVQTVKPLLRSADILARYGGEEFMIYLPYTNRHLAQEMAELIRSTVSSNQIMIGQQREPISITISLGVLAVEASDSYDLNYPEKCLNALFSAVDKALYRAKENGRNRIEM